MDDEDTMTRAMVMITTEPITCTIKYFSADSVERWSFLSEMRGINDIMLISSPIQAPIHVEAEILINVPLAKVRENNRLDGFGNIRRESVLYQWGMNPLA